MSSDYYALLTKVAQQLTKDDLEKLVFSCGNIIPPSSAEKITSGIDLFRELKQRGHLGPANYDYLSEQLIVVGRQDLASMLPDKVEILYGESKIRDRMHLGCVLSPTAPVVIPMHLSKLKFFHPNTDSRMFLMHISQQLRSQDSMKIAFLMYPTQSHITTFELAKLLEREGGMYSVDVVNRFASCLEAVGRYDLAELVKTLTAPHKLLSSLSTSQQQLTLKMNLLLYSKQQHYDFYMRALHEAESDIRVRVKLLRPPTKNYFKQFSDPSKICSLAKEIQAGLQNSHTTFLSHNKDPNSLIETSLMEALKVSQAYTRRIAFLKNQKEPLIEELCDLTEQVHESYKSFNSLMETLNWNSAVRSELRETVELHRSPFGTPAELACKYIFDISQEICQCDTLGQEMQKTDQHLLVLNSTYYSCIYHIITIQWLASLLFLYTSPDSVELNLCKLTDTLKYIIEQKKDEIVESYSNIAEIIGPDILQKLIPQNSQATDIPITWRHKNPFAFWFNILLIKLLVIATMGRETVSVGDLSFLQTDDNFCHQIVTSDLIRATITALKRQVELFRDKVLSGDRLCSRVIAKLTSNPDCY